MNNSVMLWAAEWYYRNYHFSFIVLFFWKTSWSKKKSWGLKVSKKEFTKTIILGILVFSIYYAILFLNYFIFHIDYRFWFMGVRVFQSEMLLVLLMYFPLFFIFSFQIH